MNVSTNKTVLIHEASTAQTAAEGEGQAISQLTAELFCNATLEPLYLAALRDGDVGADKLHELLRYDIQSLGMFLKAEDRALWSFADALRNDKISDGIASAIVTFAKEVLRIETASAVEDSSTKSPQPTFHLDPSTVEAILAREAYINLTPTLIRAILDSKRYKTFGLKLLSSVFEAYSHRLANAIGPDALGEDGNVLRWSRFQSVIDELATTPPRCISFAAEGTKAAQVTWSTMRAGARKLKAPGLHEGYCRVKWSSKSGFVRFVDVRVGVVRDVIEVLDGRPRVGGFVG
jgi:hypothetical protein